MDFRIGGWLIGGRPKKILIWGDHLFLNYKKKMGSWRWLIGVVLLILTWHYLFLVKSRKKKDHRV